MKGARNREQARRARIVWKAIRRYDPGDVETSVADCLTDIRHLCEVKGIDFQSALESSYDHYCVERRTT